MDNELLLLSGEDIPFIEAQLTIHQPKIKEISLIGEETFFAGCQFLLFSKENLSEQDKIGLEDKSDFDIFMSIMCGTEKMQYKNSIDMLFTLLFPNYKIKMTNTEIILMSENGVARINNTNYDTFRSIVINMFELYDSDGASAGYNPVDNRARKIAEKLRKGKEKIAKNEGKKKIAIFSRYASILAVGLAEDINIFMDYTVYQLKDQFKRFQMKQSYDVYIAAKMAGAQDLDEIDNWMDDIHP